MEGKTNPVKPFSANNIIRIPTSLEGKFFRYWLEFLKPIHRLTDREIEVVELFLKKRYQLSKVIKDDTLLDKVVMSEDIKKEIRETVGITLSHFQVIMSKLRKNKVIVDNKLNRKFLPNIDKKGDTFSLLFYFELQ